MLRHNAATERGVATRRKLRQESVSTVSVKMPGPCSWRVDAFHRLSRKTFRPSAGQLYFSIRFHWLNAGIHT